MERIPESKESLWLLIASPAIWAIHFLFCYVTAAVWCARFSQQNSSFATVRFAVAAYTAVALVGIVVIASVNFRRHRYGRASAPHDFATDADRHRFLAFATILLSGLSAVAVIYVALAAVLTGSCQ